ncbi:MAG TPA: hypothetical protein VK179_20235 [Bacteroidales bacterium]|nr:hypothetical protein [Bacteroidales bacterium]
MNYQFKTILSIFCLFNIYLVCMGQNTTAWNNEKEIKYLENREDSTTWNQELLTRDLDRNRETKSEPITYGAFPVPKYELLGQNSFKGIGSGGNLIQGIKTNGKTLLYSYFLVNSNTLNEQYLGNKENEIFFVIVVLTDFVDSVNFTHAGVQIISRNNPDYIGQGFFKTKKDQIDYVAFLTAFREEFAIINMRLFNLKYGRTILIAPQTDGSVRSKQIKGPVLTESEVDEYIRTLLKQDSIKNFFTTEGNI